MKIYNVRQNSEAWHELRLGIPTSSEFKRIVTPAGKLSKQSQPYMHRLLAEWWFGAQLEDPETQYQSGWMQRGHELEDQAVRAYELLSESETARIGFVTTDDGMIGCSPDRGVGEEGILEIKCPSPQVHIGYMLSGACEEEYRPQLQGQLLVTGRAWVDICSYCPPFPTVIIRVRPLPEFQGNLGPALMSFVEVMLAARTLLTKKYGNRIDRTAPAPDFGSLGVSEEDIPC